MEQNIIKIQKIFGIELTGEMDPHTSAAIKNFQLKLNRPMTGDLDDETYNLIVSKLGHTVDLESIEKIDDDCGASTDIAETSAAYDFSVNMLTPDEYVTQYGKQIKKKYIFLHHTAGWNNPHTVVKDWENDKRGRIGTHYIIGGINISNQDSTYDGDVVQCIPEEYFAWHLGSTSDHGINFEMHKTAVGIELCNFGWLTQRNGKFYTYTGTLVNPKFVCDLGYKFRGYQYWHKYTDKQLHTLEHLLIMLSTKYNINLAKGLQERLKTMDPAKAFDVYPDAINGKVPGLLSHTNVRKDKYDVFPQPELVELIKSL